MSINKKPTPDSKKFFELLNSFGLYTGGLIAGIALITPNGGETNSLALTIGGALIGASISAIISNLEARKHLSSYSEILKNSLVADFRSDENFLQPLRKKWHLYSVTKTEGEWCWYHYTIDFSLVNSFGKLITTVTSRDASQYPEVYDIVAGLRDERFILLAKARQSGEATAITVFPFMGKRYPNIHYGFRFHETWDLENSLDMAIISQEKLHKDDVYDNVIKCPDDSQNLTDKWNENFKNKYPTFSEVETNGQTK